MRPERFQPLWLDSGNPKIMKIGILSLQGSSEAHAQVIAGLGHEPVMVRYPEQLRGVRGLIMPGGETTAMRIISGNLGMLEAVREKAVNGLPVFGTCAGLILLASEVANEPEGFSLGLLPVKVARNAFGRQTESFEADLRLGFDPEPFRGVFIRAPRVVELREAEPVAWLGREVVGAAKDRVMGVSFHPELSGDTRLHEHFLKTTRN